MATIQKILVLDDEEMIRENLKAFLEDEGLEVIAVDNGAAALEALKSSSDIDVAIIDLKLPDMTGIEVILQSYKVTPQTKYIIHTGSIGYTLPKELTDIGITNSQVLFKPVANMNSLMSMMDNL